MCSLSCQLWNFDSLVCACSDPPHSHTFIIFTFHIAVISTKQVAQLVSHLETLAGSCALVSCLKVFSVSCHKFTLMPTLAPCTQGHIRTLSFNRCLRCQKAVVCSGWLTGLKLCNNWMHTCRRWDAKTSKPLPVQQQSCTIA